MRTGGGKGLGGSGGGGSGLGGCGGGGGGPGGSGGTGGGMGGAGGAGGAGGGRGGGGDVLLSTRQATSVPGVTAQEAGAAQPPAVVTLHATSEPSGTADVGMALLLQGCDQPYALPSAHSRPPNAHAVQLPHAAALQNTPVTQVEVTLATEAQGGGAGDGGARTASSTLAPASACASSAEVRRRLRCAALRKPAAPCCLLV